MNFKVKNVGIIQKEDELKRHYTYVDSVVSKKNRFTESSDYSGGTFVPVKLVLTSMSLSLTLTPTGFSKPPKN